MLIAQLTDLHIRPQGIAAYRVAETNMLTERALRAVARLRPAPDIVMITGDLTDCGLVDEYRLLAELLAWTLKMPVLLCPGNHDRREVLLAELPATGRAGGFVQYALEGWPVRVIMLDTVVPGAGHGELCAQRLAWLDATLAEKPEQPTLIGMHHPPFLCGLGHMDAINLVDASGFRTVLARHPQVQRIVCGHHHRNVTAPFGTAIASICPSVAHQVEFDLRPEAPAAFVMEPPAFQLHRWSAESGFVTHTVFVEEYPGPYPFLADPDYPGRATPAEPPAAASGSD
jgi:3',5'-cyclic AMP phosphodiesterase CpdA